MPKYHSLRGMPDILPEEAVRFAWIEERSREVFNLFNFSEIRTPLLEKKEVFLRSIGEDTDIVSKEMYSFKDRGDEDIALRPEGTASVLRAYIEGGFAGISEITKLFYIGPMFRGERPQKGRLRQFHQIGAEIIGSSSPYIDSELIENLLCVLKGFNIGGSIELFVNSLGCGKDRISYKKKLLSFLNEKKSGLCDDCVKRMAKNPLRSLDCKNEKCVKIVEKAPRSVDHICGDCSGRYAKLKYLLSERDITFTEKNSIVRGLDYYTGIVFEVTHKSLGSQDAIAAGGRYDGLCKEMGGPDTGAIGYAIGIERVLIALKEKDIIPLKGPVLILPIGDSSVIKAMDIVSTLRMAKIPCDTDFSGRSLKSGLRKANKENRSFVIILGEEEMKKNKVILKDMNKGTQSELTIEEAVKYVAN